MGHAHPPTPMHVDNYMTLVFANKTIKQKRSKSIDMGFYWLQARGSQEQYKIYWRPGKGHSQNPRGNLGDYHTNHFTKYRHILCRSIYLYEP